MAVGSESVWAVDLGNASLKAIHLVAVGDAVQVIGFDHIPHGKILSGGGISADEREELIAITMRQFVQRNDVSEDALIIPVPSQNSIAKFVTLPAVDAKQLPRVIQFEATQQIPFNLAEVQWDSQILNEGESKEPKVGFFAIKNEIVKAAMEHFEREDLPVGYVQIAAMALYNFLSYDRPELFRSETQATVIVNVGADCTDLVVCTKSGVWQRCIMTGGNAFTQAIAETFKLSFEKAEKLKRTAPVSKYARQIFQAMRPVFTDWAAEVQRSLGFYTSANADVKLARVIAMGGGTKLRGLTKYLQQTLEVPVEKPEAFKRLTIAEGLSAAKFHDNVADFGVVYGLGLQGVGLARIESNLLPGSVARSMAWATKTKYFIAAAIMILVFSLLRTARVGVDWIAYAKNGNIAAENRRVMESGKSVLTRNQGLVDQRNEAEEKMKKLVEAFKYREVVAELYQDILSALPNAKNNPAQAALYEAYARGDAAKIRQIEPDRSKRKQLFVVKVSISFSTDLANAQFDESAAARKSALVQQANLLEQQGAESRDSGRDRRGSDRGGPATAPITVGDMGFVVQIVGYSPYGKNAMTQLIDPPGVEDKPQQWGFITRLAHLDKYLDANSPFELYSRKAQHMTTHEEFVEYASAPFGVGVGDKVPIPPGPGGIRPVGADGTKAERYVLKDQLTGEIISADPRLNAQGQPVPDVFGRPTFDNVRDYWFSVYFKMKWKDAPTPAAPAADAGTSAPAPTPRSNRAKNN